jgi:hypothetical protein
LWGGRLTAPQPFNHFFTSFGTITVMAVIDKWTYNSYIHGMGQFGRFVITSPKQERWLGQLGRIQQMIMEVR